MTAKIEALTTTPVADFRDTDYIRGLGQRLHPKLTMVKGVLLVKEYYATATPNPVTQMLDYSDLIVKETHNYVRNEFGLALSRTILIQWTHEDGGFCTETRTRTKLYDSLASLKEGETRRRNIIDGLKPRLLGMLQFVGKSPGQAFGNAQAFFHDYQGEINSYLESGGVALAAAIGIDTSYDWMDDVVGPVDIRSAILYEIT